MSFRSVEFDFGAFGDSVVLVTGKNDDVSSENCMNGAGKTTIFNALLYAIYGEMIQTPKASHIVNWNCSPKDDVKVVLNVKVDGIPFEIDRFLVGKRKSAELHVYREGESGEMVDITRSTIAETQKMIETDVIPCGKDGFLRCLLLTADKDYNFFELGKAAKNQFFESLFELTTFTTMFGKVHRDTIDCNNSIVASSRTIDQLNASIAKLKANAERDGNRKDEIENADKEILYYGEKLREFDKNNNILLDSDGRIDFSNDVRYGEIVAKGKAASDRVKNGRTIAEGLRRTIAELKSDCASFESRIHDNDSAIASMRNAISAHDHITDILCSDCLPKYRKEVSIDLFDEEIAKRRASSDAFRADKAMKLQEIAKNEPLLVKYENAIEALEHEVAKFRDELVLLKERRAEMQNERNSIVNALGNARYRLKILKDDAAKSFESPIKSLEENLSSARTAFDDTSKKVMYLRALESVLSPENIRKNIVSDMLKELNFRICGYLSKMGSNYTCEFDEDFEPLFRSSNGKEAEYKQFSGGERMRLSIACCFAFKDFMQVRLNIRSNLLAIDEYIDSNLDVMSVNGILEMIRYMAKSEHLTAYIISHRSEVLNSFVDSEILVTKKDNESQITISRKES